jgi:hypothetical protein
MTVFLTVAIWGDSFLDLFLEFALPSYLAPGGIPELRHRGYESVFWLYTKSESAGAIQGHSQFKRLCDLVSVEIVCIDEHADISGHQTVYETMNACHLDFIARAERAQAAMIFFSPDALWSSGSLRFTLDQVESGKRAVLMAGIRANKEAIVRELEALKSKLREEGLTGRELMSLLVKSPHRITNSLTWTHEPFDIGWASHLYWPVGTAGYLGRCFHLHTFFVHPRDNAKPDVAHDFDWLEKIGLESREVCVVQDSDQMCALELSPEDRGINGRLGKKTVPVLADWARRYAAPDHRRYVRNAIYFRSGPAGSPGWIWARIWSGLVIREILVIGRLLAWLQLNYGSDDQWVWTSPIAPRVKDSFNRIRDRVKRICSP